MSYAIVSSGIVAREELGNGDFVSPEGISTSWQSVGLWSGAERMAAGIYEVQEVVPAIDDLVFAFAPPTYAISGSIVTKTFPVVPKNWSDSEMQEQIKLRAKSLINAWRDDRMDNPLPFSGKIVEADAKSREKITGAALMALIAQSTGQLYSQSWTCADNTQLTLDAVGMISLGSACFQKISSLHAAAVSAKDAISNATSAQACRSAIESFKSANPIVA